MAVKQIPRIPTAISQEKTSSPAKFSVATMAPQVPIAGSYAAAAAYDLANGYDGAYTGGYTLAQPGIPNGGEGFPGSYAVLF